MNQIMYNKSLLLLLMSIVMLVHVSKAQSYEIHKRGMLHQTVFNTGDIGRPWVTGTLGDNTNVPVFEWPPYSRTVVNGISYDGQHNIVGAGVYLGANFDGQPGKDKRKYSICGGVGTGQGPEVVVNRYVFPLSIDRIENYPLLEDGELNPNYNPDEAEEIITAKWATTLGITVTRTSRVWSYPDYDDMIIYEYEFEYTGDTDGNPATIEQTTNLKDFMVCFNYGFGPSMYGYQRHYGTWKYDGGLYQGDNNNIWDSEYWLSYNQDSKTSTDPNLPGGKPEPNKELFLEYSQTGENGGGFCSPQAPGYAILYYTLDHLAILDPLDTALNESEYTPQLSNSGGVYYELDASGRLKQPYSNKISTGNTASSKLENNWLSPTDGRWSGIWGASTNIIVPPNIYGGSGVEWSANWSGRAKYNRNQTAQACSKMMVFGPYTIRIGDKLKYALAEVCGYGADSLKDGITKYVQGGYANYWWPQNTQWAESKGMDRKVVIGGETITEHYLTDFGYPDYVNSNVRTVQQVAHNAFKAYVGQEPTLPVWPENNPSVGDYKIPVPCPAPVIVLTNTASADINLQWKRSVENFTHLRLMGTISNYKIYKSTAGMGPWKLVTSINVGDVNENDMYEYLDVDIDFKIGESRYYAVTSVDNNGNESGKTNIIEFTKKVGAVEQLGQVYAVPNPFISKSGYSGDDGKIGFYGLPVKCTIKIFTYAGQLVESIDHDAADSYSTEWFQTSKNGQEIASGLYLYVVTTPEGETSTGKFVVIK